MLELTHVSFILFCYMITCTGATASLTDVARIHTRAYKYVHRRTKLRCVKASFVLDKTKGLHCVCPGMTALHHAVDVGKMDVAKFLIENGAGSYLACAFLLLLQMPLGMVVQMSVCVVESVLSA